MAANKKKIKKAKKDDVDPKILRKIKEPKLDPIDLEDEDVEQERVVIDDEKPFESEEERESY